jgi:hypothetical protein
MKTETVSNSVEKALDEKLKSAQASPARDELSRTSLSIDRRQLIICLVIFFVALGVRLLSWQDNRFEARKVQTAVTEGYKHTGRLIQQAGLSGFFSASTLLSDPNHLGHPPGYPIVIAFLFKLFGETDAALQIFQILADSACVLLVFLIALALLNTATATIAGLLVALAPQFTYNSVMLLPDTLSVLPVLLAIYLLVRAVKRPRLATIIMSGALVGVSCWLRANTMLLAPFLLVIFPILFERGKRLRYGLALVCGSLLVILPLTIRNAIVYDHFIPVSLGAGQTFLEGIADYDEQGTLGIPNTDMGLMKWEAGIYNRPDYYGTLFNPDGVKRDRERLAYGFSVVRSHPLWFFGVMVRRGISMFRLERVRLISPDPPVTHSLVVPDGTTPVWSNSPADLIASGRVASSQVEVSLSPDESALHITGDDSRYEDQFTFRAGALQKNVDYVLKLPVRIERGRMFIRVVGVNDNYEYASAIIEPQDWKPANEQPLNLVEIPFVSGNSDQVQVVFANGGSNGVRPFVQVGQSQLYALGESSYTWMRIPRFLTRLLQKPFITAIMLPLAVIGLLLLIRKRQWRDIALLLVVPAYFICIQSALHTEYRYVLAIHYFFFVLVAVTLYRAGKYGWKHSASWATAKESSTK